jgi:hypothetical protein
MLALTPGLALARVPLLPLEALERDLHDLDVMVSGSLERRSMGNFLAYWCPNENDGAMCTPSDTAQKHYHMAWLYGFESGALATPLSPYEFGNSMYEANPTAEDANPSSTAVWAHADAPAQWTHGGTTGDWPSWATKQSPPAVEFTQPTDLWFQTGADHNPHAEDCLDPGRDQDTGGVSLDGLDRTTPYEFRADNDAATDDNGLPLKGYDACLATADHGGVATEFLPWTRSSCTYMDLTKDAFFTGPLSGCTVAVVFNTESPYQARAIHCNAGDGPPDAVTTCSALAPWTPCPVPWYAWKPKYDWATNEAKTEAFVRAVFQEQELFDDQEISAALDNGAADTVSRKVRLLAEGTGITMNTVWGLRNAKRTMSEDGWTAIWCHETVGAITGGESPVRIEGKSADEVREAIMSAVNSALDANDGVRMMTGQAEWNQKQSAMARSIQMIAIEFMQGLGLDPNQVDTAQIVNAAASGYDPNDGWIGWSWGAKDPDNVWRFYQSQAKQGDTGPLVDGATKYFQLKTKALNPPEKCGTPGEGKKFATGKTAETVCGTVATCAERCFEDDEEGNM